MTRHVPTDPLALLERYAEARLNRARNRNDPRLTREVRRFEAAIGAVVEARGGV